MEELNLIPDPETFDGENINELRHSGMPDKFEKLFEKFREKGLVTIEGIVCCQTCGGYEIGTFLKKVDQEDRDIKDSIKGYVYFIIQDIEDFRGHGRPPEFDFSEVYLSYGSAWYHDSENDEKVYLPNSIESTLEVGKLVRDIAKDCDFEVEWEETEDKRIAIKP